MEQAPEPVGRGRRSPPITGVRPVAEDIADDDLYAVFVEFLGCYGRAREVAPDVIRLDIADDHYPPGREPGQPLIVRVDRAQLRALSWTDVNVFDDSDLDVLAPTDRHLGDGFETLTFYLEEEFDSGVGDRAGVVPGTLVPDDTLGGFVYLDD